MDCCCKDIIQRGNYRMELIENFPCRNRNELLWRERYHIEQSDCINKNPPILTKDEYTERHKIIKRKYNATHREEINEYYSEKIQCECGAMSSRGHITRHRKSKIHLELMSPPSV